MPLIERLFRTKKFDSEIPDSERPLKRVLGPIDLILLGIGGIVGAGIFALVGTAAAGDESRLGAGPALVISFMLTALACGFTGLCYADFASMAPTSGSAYTYAYASLGEIIAWIIGWDLILEYAVGNIAVAVSWSGYFCEFVHDMLGVFNVDYKFPWWLSTDLRSALDPANRALLDAAPHIQGIPIVFNLPAVFIVTAITLVLIVGIKESAWFNGIMVGIKLLVLGFFIYVGLFHIEAQNWHPFAPNGWQGIQAGAAAVFFAFIGFDAVSTAAEECRNPRRDLPIGILGSLGFCTVIYMAVAVVLTGMIPWQKLNTAEPLTLAMNMVHQPNAALIVAFGSIVAHTAVLLVFQLGQPRILYAMARDGLLPKALAGTHKRFRTPHVATIFTGLFVGVGSALASLDEMADLCNIGTLSAFIIVCAGIIVLRFKEPERPRSFRTPLVPLVPILGIVSCLWLMLGLPTMAWIRFAVWLVIGITFYAVYGWLRGRFIDVENTASS
jgi:APA family basic amino acid/polyamine antiporter